MRVFSFCEKSFARLFGYKKIKKFFHEVVKLALCLSIGEGIKSETTVKTALNEAGLLQRRSGGFSKPNHIFLKILTEVENSELGEKQSVGGSDNCLSYGKKCDCDKASSSAPNKVIEKSNYSQNNEVSSKPWTLRERNVGKYKRFDEINYNCEEGESL